MKPCLKAFVFVWLVLGLIPLNTVAKTPLKVHVSILPQQYFVERIGRDRVAVDVLVTPGKSPATYSPSPDQIKKLAASDVYFRIGVPFENSILDKIKSMAGIRIVDTRQGIALRTMAEHHDDEKKHDGDIGKDPHIWMDPLLVKTQAHTVFTTLSSLDPGNRDFYEQNYQLFIRDLDALDHSLKNAFEPLRGQHLFVFHPSFGYLADAYGLKQVAVETMGKAPRGKVLSNIIKLAREQGTRVIFAQPQFDSNTAKKIASAINGIVVLIDPLAHDYLINMENIAKSITSGLNN